MGGLYFLSQLRLVLSTFQSLILPDVPRLGPETSVLV